MTFYQILWSFFLYSFAGWCCEVVFAACKTGRFVNRGFLFGPMCPIYGFGVVAAVLLIEPIRAHWLQAYLVAVFVPTVLEYIVGWGAVKLLHTRLWDYSRMPLNIGGHVCLLFSLVWGLGCLIIVYLLQPLVLELIKLLPVPLSWVLLALFTATALTDLILTAIEAAKIPKRLRALEEGWSGVCGGSPTGSVQDSPAALWSSGKRGRRNSPPRNGRSFWAPWATGSRNSWHSGMRFWRNIRASGKSPAEAMPASEGLPPPAADRSAPPLRASPDALSAAPGTRRHNALPSARRHPANRASILQVPAIW